VGRSFYKFLIVLDFNMLKDDLNEEDEVENNGLNEKIEVLFENNDQDMEKEEIKLENIGIETNISIFNQDEL
jgi:hypothetical protein